MKGNAPNHLGDFYEGIRIRALFSKGQCRLCVASWRMKIRGSVGGLLEERLLGVGEKEWRIHGEWRNMLYFVCDFNEKMVEGFEILVVYLFY